MVMRNMLSQDNYPSPASDPKPTSRVFIAGLLTTTLAVLGLMATTTQLQWRLPVIGSNKAAPASTAPLPAVAPKAAPQLTINQPGNNIIIEKLPAGYGFPLTSDGMPEFYKTVLEPAGNTTGFGLTQRQARKGFGFDGQDIFVAYISGGSYVLHCQRSTTATRAMCWRQLALSGNTWIQYRFPRSQLNDWRRIEQTVRANIS